MPGLALDRRGAGNHFRRFISPDPDGAVYFLPWRTSFVVARALGLLQLPGWRLCYELPNALVSPDPLQCAAAIRLIASATKVVAPRNIKLEPCGHLGVLALCRWRQRARELRAA